MPVGKAIFVTATDTSAGKTFVATLLARVFRERGLKVGVMKPVETGCPLKEDSLFPEDTFRLIEASGFSAPLEVVNPYRFSEPLAPTVAARLNGVKIEPEVIENSFERIRGLTDITIVEGAGGIAVPLCEGLTMGGLAKRLGLGVVVVVPQRLGCINHTLLTTEYAHSLGLDLKGVVLNHVEKESDPSTPYNRGELERLGVKIIGELPHIKGERLPDEIYTIATFLL
ncbi:MAG TPA: dethiobiotin synthase [Deltaproteobacteria bacterium]|nr:dethiobiotin synthase [Deltaproteobacteria bacterium]